VKKYCPLTYPKSQGYINDKIFTYTETNNYFAMWQMKSCNLFCGNHSSLVLYFSLTIVVNFSRKKYSKLEIRVDVTSEGKEGVCNDNTWWQSRTDVDWPLCSEKVRPEACEKLCGVGTGRAIPVTNDT
jgi:hypothetical protein